MARVTASGAELAAEAQALLERRRTSNRRSPVAATINRLAAGEPAPMSFAQWRLWFLEQLRPGTNAWNTPVAVRLRGRLDLDALHRSIEFLVKRHATLRTVFPAPNKRPAPMIFEHVEVALPVVEAAHSDRVAVTDAEVERFVQDEVGRPFHLESDLMLRARVLRLGAEDHVLVLVAHHIACDGWSKGLLVRELGIAYDAFSAGAEPILPELEIEYGDFAAWQRRWLAGENLERLTGYWRERLAGHALCTELPTDLPRPRIQQFRGAVEWLAVPAALANGAIALGRRERATPFMTLIAAFYALLHACTGQEDLLLGSPSAMRERRELGGVVGLFANTLVYRTDLSGRPSFAELIGRVRDTALGVYRHQDLPFEQIVETVRPKRDPSRNPLVQVNMRVEGREPVPALRGLRSEPLSIDPGLARFDLAIELGATDDGFGGYLEYDTSLFTQPTAARFARDYVEILGAAVARPDLPLAQLAPIAAITARPQPIQKD